MPGRRHPHGAHLSPPAGFCPTGWCRRAFCGRIGRMSRPFADSALFFREYLRNFHTTGAILPSGRRLAAALTRFVRSPSSAPRRILEVGPGTGAVTRRIVRSMDRSDRLDLVELNDTFVAQLRRRFQVEPAFLAMADRTRVLHCPVEDLPGGDCYDVIVSGLPLNNFSVAQVERILTALTGRLTPGGMLSFFEYIAVRPARALVSGRADRVRLRGVGKALRAVLDRHEVRRDAVWLNVPPAWVHHVQTM
jgi:phosphatidylethanolamine/phosphatidyl-N-methylethanolamine N-methyltransferase